MARVLITGVRGKTGLLLARMLAGRNDVEVQGGSSSPASVELDGVVATAFSWDAPADWAAATDGVDAVYLVRPDRADAPDRIAGLLAATPPDTRVVLLSERDADALGAESWAMEIERLVTGGTRPWTVLRPGWFMQVLTDPRFYRDDLVERGELRFAGGGASVAWIDARDIAAVAAHALLEAGHEGATYEITGPESLTLPATASALGQALGRPVRHVEQSVADAVAGLQGFDRDETVWTLERLARGDFAPVTDVVEQVTGRAARRLADLRFDED